MAFVKLDCGILDSTLWIDRDAREVFITALLMAHPYELVEPTPELKVRKIEQTGWEIPPGWYGLVPAAGIGIVHRAGLERKRGMAALERLALPEEDSRSKDFDGRRLVRVSGGYIVLNFIKYRERDHSAAERSKRYRERKRGVASRVVDVTSRVTSDGHAVASRNVTQAEAEAEAEAEKSTTLTTRKKRVSWLSPYYTAWQRRYGGNPAGGQLAKALKPLHDEHGETLVLERWTHYLQATEPRYANAHRFAQTWGSWANGKAVPQTYTYSPGERGPAL